MSEFNTEKWSSIITVTSEILSGIPECNGDVLPMISYKQRDALYKIDRLNNDISKLNSKIDRLKTKKSKEKRLDKITDIKHEINSIKHDSNLDTLLDIFDIDYLIKSA